MKSKERAKCSDAAMMQNTATACKWGESRAFNSMLNDQTMRNPTTWNVIIQEAARQEYAFYLRHRRKVCHYPHGNQREQLRGTHELTGKFSKTKIQQMPFCIYNTFFASLIIVQPVKCTFGSRCQCQFRGFLDHLHTQHPKPTNLTA